MNDGVLKLMYTFPVHTTVLQYFENHVKFLNCPFKESNRKDE